MEEISSNGSEKLEGTETKRMLEIDIPEKKEDLFRDPNLRKLPRKSSGISKNIETDSASSIQSSRKNSSRKGKSSQSYHDGMLPTRSKTLDSSGSSEKSLKIFGEVVDDVSKRIPNPCINSDCISKINESADVIEGEMRKTSSEVMIYKIENEGEKPGILNPHQKQEEMDTS